MSKVEEAPTATQREFSDVARQQAERILSQALPVMRGHDNALDNLFYIELNERTTLPSIAAALYVLGLWPKSGAK